MYYRVLINDVPKIAFVSTVSDDNVAELTFYAKAEEVGNKAVTSQDVYQVAFEETLPLSQFQILSRVYVVSLACFRETGPWPDNVYCIQGKSAHPLDDGDSFLAWCYQFRKAIKNGIKPSTDRGSATIYTSSEIFNTVFGQFEPGRANLDMGYSVFHFSPPKDNITPRDKGFISGFTEKESLTAKLVESYVHTERVASVELGQGIRLILNRKSSSIELGKGHASSLKRKLKVMTKKCSTHPSLPHVHIVKEGVNGKFPVFRHSCTFEDIQKLEAITGKFTRKGRRSIRQKNETDVHGVLENPKFKITYRPAKFNLRVKFTHISD